MLAQYELCAGMDCFNGTSRLGGTFSLKALLGVACIMSGLMLFSCPRQNNVTEFSLPLYTAVPLIGAITACREDFHRMQLFRLIQ